MNDDMIIALLQKRDECALSEIRRKYGALCFRIAKQMLGSDWDAEECVSEMMLSAWNSIPPYTPQNLAAFLVTLIRRYATDLLRSQSRQKRGGSQMKVALDELAEVIPARETVESEVDRRALTTAIRSFLDSLPEQSRQIFLERYYFAKPVRAIAEAHQKQISAVNVLLHRLRKRLKKHLEREGFF